MDNKTRMVTPWGEYFNALEAFFRKDDGVKVEFADNTVIKVYVEGEEKAEALRELLPASKTWGNVTVNINVLPANPLDTSRIALYRKAFEGNDAVVDIETIGGISSNDFNFVIFKPEVVQFFNDDFSDYNGIRSTLYQDLAKELFGEDEGIFFCTDKVE